MNCRRLPSEDALRLVGDPVDVITGAVIDATVDLTVDAPFPFTFVRHYSSANSEQNRGLGWGHTHGFDHALRFTYDNKIGYMAPDGRRVTFPFLPTDGTSTGRHGFRLERVHAQWYRVHLPEGDEVLEFELWRPDWPARLAAISHPAGATKVYYNNQTGLLASFVDSAGHSVRVDWVNIPDTHGRARPHIASLVLVISAPPEHGAGPSNFAATAGMDERLLTYRYDAWARLIGGTDHYRNTFAFEYDAEARMTRLTDRRSYSFLFKYDSRGRCVHTTGEDGVEDVKLEYLEDATLVTLADGGEWIYEHSGGSLGRIIDPYGGEHRRELDEEGQLREETDPAGRRFTIVRDTAGKALGRRDSAGHVWPMGQEAPKPPPHYVAANAREWDYGALLPTKHGLPPRRYLELDGLPGFIVDALAPSSGDLFADTLERWRENTVRDLTGVRLRVERKDGMRRSWTYDASGNRQRFTDFDGGTWRWSHVSWNHTREIVDPLGGVTELTYSRRETLLRAVDPGGYTSEYAYDLKSRLTGVRRDRVWRETYTYDAGDELSEKIDTRGQCLLRYEREDEGRKVTLTLAGGERHEMRYTAERRLQSAVIDTAEGKRDEYSFAYRFEGKRVRDERNGRGVRRRLHGERLVEMCALDRFATRYTWRGSDRMEIADPTGATHQIQICHGGVARRSMSNGVTEVTQYHPHGYTLAKFVYNRGGQRWDRRYRRSGEGDVKSIEDNTRGTSWFDYDAAHRLIGETPPNARKRVFEYTRSGDLIVGPGLHGVTMGRRHQLDSANGSRFEYDHRDSLCARHGPAGTVHLRHDARDQLVMMHGQEWGLWTARYDVLGRRIETAFNGAKTSFFWDSDRLAAEVSPDGRVRIYVYADDLALTPILFIDYASALADPVSGIRYFVFANHLGAPEMVQNDAGEVVWRARYEAYGMAVVEIGAPFHQPLRWPGHYFDVATGLQYARFRYYSPELGRFTQSDPDGVQGGVNLHAYGDGNPLRNVDVRGLGCPPNETGGNDEEGKPAKEKSKRKGDPDAEVGDRPIDPNLRQKLQQAREAQKRAEAAGMNLTGENADKCVASNGHLTISGYTKTPPKGFSREGSDAPSMLAYQQKIDHPPRPQGKMDTSGSGANQKTVPGAAASTHAEKQLAIQQMNDGTNHPMGVSKEQCGDCRSFMQKHAQDRGEPITLADPEYTRVYQPDGSVQVYDPNHNLVQSVPPNQPPKAKLTSNYEGNPW